MIRGLNHLTLASRDPAGTARFYEDVLGARVERLWSGGAYLSLGRLWLCLSSDEHAAPSSDYTHYAFDVAREDFDDVAARIQASGATIWKENRSGGRSLYFADPEGHRLELHVGDLVSRLAAIDAPADERGCLA